MGFETLTALDEWQPSGEEIRNGGLIRIVDSSRQLDELGWEKSPIAIVASQTENGRRFVCVQEEAGWVNMTGALAELTSLEAGWVGNKLRIRGPVGSQISDEEMVAVISRHLTSHSCPYFGNKHVQCDYRWKMTEQKEATPCPSCGGS